MVSALDLKETEQEWIGTVPSHWDLKKIKFVFWNRKENNNPIKSKNLLSLTVEKGVIPHSEKTGGGNKPKDDLTKYKLVYPGDIVLNSMNVIAGAVGISKYFGLVSPVYYMLVPKNSDHINEYFHHLFQTEIFQKSLYGLGNGILIKENEDTGKLSTIRMKIPMDKLGDQYIPVPPAEEQKLIARYLDKKTNQIEMLIEKIQKKIELLKAHRNTLINQCVTKGLDPNVEMKDSGVLWIGEIAKHFKLVNLRWVIDSIKDGTHGTHPSSDDGKVLLSGKNVHDGFLKINDDERCIPKEEHEKITKNGYPKQGDVLVSSVGSIGRSCVYELTEPISFQRSVCFIRPSSKVNSYYLSYLIRSNVCQTQINTLINQTTVGGIYIDDLKNLSVIIPPEKEQIAIVKYLDKELKAINSLIEKNEISLNLLNEYRQSLISSVVTGKVHITEEML